MVKKVCFTILFSILFSTVLFAESGAEFILNSHFSAAINGDPKYIIKQNNLSTEYKDKTQIGFDSGASVQFGYMFQVANNFGISVLGELGYSYNTFAGFYNVDASKDQLGIGNQLDGRIYYNTHNLISGAVLKFNIHKYAIGLGFGSLTPLGLDKTFENETLRNAIGNKSTAIYSGIYTKLTFDYSIYLTEKFALNLGLYSALNYSLKNATTVIDDTSEQGNLILESKLLSYDVGIQVGLRFAPQLSSSANNN